MARDKVVEKLNSLFKEEMWGRIEIRDTGISKFKILEDLFDSIVNENMISEAVEICSSHISEHPDSITSAYLLGVIGYSQDDPDKSIHLRKLIDTFVDHHKWAVVELLSEKILEFSESSVALRGLATALERLGRNREAIPVLENLLKIDRFDAQVAKKLATALVDSDSEKSVYYMKLSIEGFIKNAQYDEVTAIWNKLVSISWEDVAFFERNERLLVEAKKQELAAQLLKTLLGKYKDNENPDQSIIFLKKILAYLPDDQQSRRDLVRLYEKKYEHHSQLQQFLKLSNLNNMGKPVKYAIQDFERNIIFDKGNFAHHSSWGLGHIDDIDSEFIIISFQDKKDHKMSIQMALQSLTPVEHDHFYVKQFQDPQGMKELFKKDFIEFFSILIKSFGGMISMEDIKRELVPAYIDSKGWTKWWNRGRTAIRKSPNFGVSEKKKNSFYIREKPVTLADELLENLIATESFSEKLTIAIEFVNNVDISEGSEVTRYFVDFFQNEVKGKSITRSVLSFFILNDFSRFLSSSSLKLEPVELQVKDIIRQSNELPLLSRKISSYDYKKHLVQLVEETRDDWPDIYYEILFESPVRIHKYLMNKLIVNNEYRVINQYINRIVEGYREYPELFIWVSRNLLYDSWSYDWLEYSKATLYTSYFRFMNELKKVEKEGNRMKNMALDVLVENEGAVLFSIAQSSDGVLLGRLYDIFRNIPYVDESHVNIFQKRIKECCPDFDLTSSHVMEGDELSREGLVVTKKSFEEKTLLLERMVNVDMVALTKDLAAVAENSGDMRENVDYTALMEKQNILELEIKKMGEDLKAATILEESAVTCDMVSIGTTITLKDSATGEAITYDILGPWDADFEKNRLSYRSPLAALLLGKKKGETVDLIINDQHRSFLIDTIALCREIS